MPRCDNLIHKKGRKAPPAFLEPFKLGHQVTQPIHLALIQRTALQPAYVLSQLLHRAALEHRPQRHVELQLFLHPRGHLRAQQRLARLR